jgi:RNA polymerase sigma factor (sigma-70 family)
MWAAAWKVLNPNIDDTRDAIADAQTVVFQRFDGFRGTTEGEWRGWLYTIARRRALDQVRGRRPTMEILDDVEYDEPREGAGFVARVLPRIPDPLLQRKLRDCYEGLAPIYREAIDSFDHSHEEIADRLDITVGQSRVRRMRALQLLGKCLRSKGITEGDWRME